MHRFISCFLIIVSLLSCGKQQSPSGEEASNPFENNAPDKLNFAPTEDFTVLEGTINYMDPVTNALVNVEVVHESGKLVPTNLQARTNDLGQFKILLPVQGDSGFNLATTPANQALKVFVSGDDKRPELANLVGVNIYERNNVAASVNTISSVLVKQIDFAKVSDLKNFVTAELPALKQRVADKFGLASIDESSAALYSKCHVLAEKIDGLRDGERLDPERLLSLFVESVFSVDILSDAESEAHKESLKAQFSEIVGEVKSAGTTTIDSTGAAVSPTANTEISCDTARASPYANSDSADGSLKQPLWLCTPAHFFNLTRNAKDWGKSFVLGRDLDFADYDGSSPEKSLYPIGGGAAALAFTGQFEGRGYRLSNLKLNSSYYQYSDQLGVFGYTQNATITDLNLSNVVVGYPHSVRVGALIGYAGSGSRVRNVHLNSVKVLGSSSVGGAIGENLATVIRVAIDNVTVNASKESDYSGGMVGLNKELIQLSSARGAYVVGGSYVGTFVGRNDAHILNSYAQGSIQGYHGVGGFAGKNISLIENSYSVAKIMASGQSAGISASELVTLEVGGFVGQGLTGTYNGSVWERNTAASYHTVGFTDLGEFGTDIATVYSVDSDKMLTSEFYFTLGWDSDLWNIQSSGSMLSTYPVLMWQAAWGRCDESVQCLAP